MTWKRYFTKFSGLGLRVSDKFHIFSIVAVFRATILEQFQAEMRLCLISVCPPGFEPLDNRGCVSVISEAATKSEAAQKCKEMNPWAHLLQIKTAFQQMKVQQFFSDKSLTGSHLCHYIW